MRPGTLLFLAGIFAIGCFTPLASGQTDSDQWGQWRGPTSTGSSDTAKPPIAWSETENVAWKTKLPGLGHSSPIVWGDHVFVTSAVPVGDPFDPIPDNAPGSHDNLKVSQSHQYVLLDIDRATGKIRWQKTLNTNVPHEGAHATASLASASAVTDGTHVFASFGSHGLFCLDFDGNLVWKHDLGTMRSKHGHGEGASPALFGDTLVVNWDHEKQSFLVAFNKSNGEIKWQVQRREVTSWSSPIIVDHAGKQQVIVAGSDRIRGYDLESGKEIWSCGGMSQNIVATPVADNGMVFVGSSYEIRTMLGIRWQGATGDVTNTDRVVWSRSQRTPYVPSPLVYRGKLYFLRHYQGVLTQLDAASGEELAGPFRLGRLRDIYASPVAADDRLYVVDRSGITMVVSHSQIPKLLSVNQLDDHFSASPALVGTQMFLRGEKALYCLENKANHP